MSGPHKWAPITDFPEDPNSITEGELRSLGRVWDRQKQELIDRGVLDEYDKRLRREWSIETGIIERVYTLDRGVTRTLIERGIDAALIPHGASDSDSTRVARIIQDHYDALEGMFDFVRGQRRLTTGYVKELHAALLRNQDTYQAVDQFGQRLGRPLDKGSYKMTPNSPTRPDGSVHEYCPPEHVAAEMDRLIALHAEHDSRGVPPEVEAAWVHHRFSQIHPFADGNGRVARALASLVFIKANWFPLVVKRDDWSRYIDALERADEGDLTPLVDMFVEAQRSAAVAASDVALEAAPVTTAQDAISAARDRLIQRGRLPVEEWSVAKNTATNLVGLAVTRLGFVSEQLRRDIGSGFLFEVIPTDGDAWTELRSEVVHKAGQVPDFKEYNTTVQLKLDTGRSECLTLSFHGIGPKFRGLLGVVAYYVQGQPATSLGVGVFQVNYEESLEAAQGRFSNWLERIIVAGLDQWRRTL